MALLIVDRPGQQLFETLRQMGVLFLPPGQEFALTIGRGGAIFAFELAQQLKHRGILELFLPRDKAVGGHVMVDMAPSRS